MPEVFHFVEMGTGVIQNKGWSEHVYVEGIVLDVIRIWNYRASGPCISMQYFTVKMMGIVA